MNSLIFLFHSARDILVVDKMGNIQQVTNYYPFGTPIHDLSNNPEFQPFKYNGKELDVMHGLNTLDYGARQYNPVLPVWDRVDPLAEKNYGVSPYAYCNNDPVNKIDPNGEWGWDVNGNLVAQNGDNVKSMATFLGASQYDAIEMLNRNKISVSKNGEIIAKNINGLVLDKSSLYVMKADKSGVVLESKVGLALATSPLSGCKAGSGPHHNSLAVMHYFTGNGEPADVGDAATAMLMNTPRFKENLKKTTTENRNDAEFSVDMTGLVFHIGRTPVNYTVHRGSRTSHVDFHLFQYKNGKMDSFSDPLDLGFEFLGGMKYDYKLRTVTYYFKPVK